MPEPGASNLRRSHTSTSEWQSFEVRMRRRRALRCVLRAEIALEAGYPEDARAAIEEARRLDPAVLGIDAVEARVPHAVAPPAPARPRAYMISGTAAALVLAVMAALLSIPSDPNGLPTSFDTLSTAPAVEPDTASVTPGVARVGVREQVIVAPLVGSEQAPRAQAAPEPAAAPPAPAQRAASEPERGAPAAVAATTGSGVARNEVEVAPRAAATPPPQPEPVARALAPPAVEPVPATPSPAASAPVRTAAEREPDAVAANREIPSVDDAARVRAVLSRYAAAYSGLDASAARAVWPAVDERALARAFSGLQSQRVSLDDCEVSVSGASARAQCQGSASWVPKVGGGGRTESRQWSFDLRNTQGGWHITRAEAR